MKKRMNPWLGRACQRLTPCGVLLVWTFSSCAPVDFSSQDAFTIKVRDGVNQLSAAGESVTLVAFALDGAAPYAFRWSQERGPEEAFDDEADLTQDVVTTRPLETEGEYVFRLTVTDSRGAFVARWITLLVGPPGSDFGDDFDVVIEINSNTLEFGEEFPLSAFSNSTKEVRYQWRIRSGNASLSEEQGVSTLLRNAQVGRVTVEIAATEIESGEVADDAVTLTVLPVIHVDRLHLVTVDETLTLETRLEPELPDASFEWVSPSNSLEIDDSTTASSTMIAQASGAFDVTLNVTVPLEEDAVPSVTAQAVVSVVAVEELSQRVAIRTNLGAIILQMEGEAAPKNVANFLRHVDREFYDGLLIHRYSCELNVSTGECFPFVIQGGAYARGADGLEFHEPLYDPVPGEQDNGLSNTLHTVAMALTADDPDSGTTQFFINMTEDNSFLDDRFTVFARVTGGFDVLDAITRIETTEDPNTGLKELPVEDVIMENVKRIDE